MPCNCEVDVKDAGSHSNGCLLNGRSSEPTNGHQPHRKTFDNDDYLDPQTSGKAPRESVRLFYCFIEWINNINGRWIFY